MLKSHRICLRPTAEQESLFLQHAGYARFAYNWAVGEFKAGLDVGEWLNERTVIQNLMKSDTPALQETTGAHRFI